MIHGMIDLETLSVNPDAVVLTIGAIKFDPHSDQLPHDPLYFKVDVDAQTALGRHVDESTLDWWSKQPKEIAEEALGEKDRVSLDDTVKKLNRWCVGIDVYWCQGPLFDYAILQNFYKNLNVPCPWNYWQVRDSRTLFNLLPPDPAEKREEKHNALADCDYQARKVQRYYRELNIKKF
jgi:hypothetical protein